MRQGNTTVGSVKFKLPGPGGFPLDGEPVRRPSGEVAGGAREQRRVLHCTQAVPMIRRCRRGPAVSNKLMPYKGKRHTDHATPHARCGRRCTHARGGAACLCRLGTVPTVSQSGSPGPRPEFRGLSRGAGDRRARRNGALTSGSMRRMGCENDRGKKHGRRDRPADPEGLAFRRP
jgi:hypothetical protein